MSTYILRRILQSIPLLLFISILCFVLMHAAPGGPLARLQEDPRARPEDIALKKHILGLDRPLPVQYASWLGKALVGDFGTSITTGQPVMAMIRERLPATGQLMLTAFFISLGVGVGIGIVTAVFRAGWVDYVATMFSFVGISIPVFWLALMAQLVFGVWLKWLPVTGRSTLGETGSIVDTARHLVMPVVVLSLLYTASWSRYMRGQLIEVLSQDYVRTARAKGLSGAVVIVRHAVRNALIPVVTIVALQIPELFTGAIITEAIFAWPGMGRLFYEGIGQGDYPRLMAIFMISSVLIVLFNLLADMLYAVLDPRISYFMSAASSRLDRPETFASLAWRRFKRHRVAVASAAFLVALTLATGLVRVAVSPQASVAMHLSDKLAPPSLRHPFGTNDLGQDYFVRSLYGGEVSLGVGVFSMLVALVVGTTLGAVAGARGGRTDNLVMRGVDVMLAIPIFFLLLLLGSFFPPSLPTVVLIIGITSWTDICRLVRAAFLSLREKEFVESARAIGVPGWLIAWRHLLPNASSPIIVAATLGMARAIVTESALSYLGFGVQPPNVSWGSMLRNAQNHFDDQPWLAIFPGLLIFLTVLSFNFLGDGLRDAMDPRTTRR